MREYYGDNWQNDTSAKVILICHSMGAPSTRWALVVDPEIRNHVAKIITIGGVNKGTPPASKFPFGEMWFSFQLFFLPWEFISGAITHPTKILDPSVWTLNTATMATAQRFLFSFLGYEGFVEALDLLWIPLKYTDATNDLGEWSDFQDQLNSGKNIKLQKNSKYVFIASNWAPPAGIAVVWVATAIQVVYYFSRFFDPLSIFVGGLKLASATSFTNWLFTSDFLVPKWSALCEYVAFPDTERIWVRNIRHDYQPKHAGLILQALEERPLIDSVMLIQSFEDGRVDTTYLSENKIDTIMTSFQNLRIEGKLKKTYFLAQAAPKVIINGINLGKLKYPQNCGYEGRKFFLDSTYLKYLGAGINKITLKSRNVVGEEFTRNYTLWMVPSGWFCMQESPDYRNVLSSLPLNDTFKIRLIKLGTSDSLEQIKWDSLRINFVRLTQDTNGWFVINPEDTEYILIPDSLYSYDDSVPEGPGCYNGDYLECPGKRLKLAFINLKNFLLNSGYDTLEGIYNFYYAVNDNYKTVRSFHQFYIDKTSPLIQIIGPEGVYSKNTSDSIAVIFKVKDNFETELMTPDNLLWSLKDKNGNSIYSKYYNSNDEPGFYYYEDLFIDFIPKEILQNLSDGKYYVEIKVSDRAGNESVERRYFRIDNNPPEIYVIEKMDSVLTSNENFIEFKFNVNEWANFRIVLKDVNDTLKKYIKEMSALPSAVYDTFLIESVIRLYNKFVISKEEIEDGVYSIYAELSDSAGNKITLSGNDICGNNTLRVDKTPPLLSGPQIQPLVAENHINFNFRGSQENDYVLNKKGAIFKIFVDSIFRKDFELSASSETIRIYDTLNVSNLSKGKHILEIRGKDPFGNAVSKRAIFFKNTYGTEISFPSGDTLDKGLIVIKGTASDPDIYDNLPFKNFEIYWAEGIGAEPSPTQKGGIRWNSNYIEVREDLRREGKPLNFGFKEVNSDNILAIFNTSNLPRGKIKLRLISRDTLNYLEDTVSFYLTDKFALNPDVDMFLKVKRGEIHDTLREDTFRIKGTEPGRSGDTLLLDLTRGDTLVASYFLKDAPSNVKFQILSMDDEILYEKTDDDIYPLNGTPLSFDSSGFYIYSDSDSILYIGFKSDDSVVASLSLNAKEIFDVDSIYVDSGFSFFNYENSLNVFAFGKFSNLNKIRVKAKPPFVINKTFSKVFLGKNLYEVEDNSFYAGGNSHKWDGRIYPSMTTVPPGKYKVRFIAYGKKGGYAQREKIIKVKSYFIVRDISVNPNVITVNDTNLSKVSLSFKANMDLKADIFVMKGSSIVDTVCVDKGFYGAWNSHSVIWDASKKPFINSGFYKFKLVLKPIYSDMNKVLYSPIFQVKNIPVVYDTSDLYIPDEYIEGRLNGKPVYDAKPEYLFRLKARGRLTPPLPFKIKVNRKSAKMPLKMKWRVDYYTPDSIFTFSGYIKTLNSGDSLEPDQDYINKVVRIIKNGGDTNNYFYFNFYKDDIYYFGEFPYVSSFTSDYCECARGFGIFVYFFHPYLINCFCKKLLIKPIDTECVYIKIYDTVNIDIQDSLLGISDSGTFYIVDTNAVYKAYTSFYPAGGNSAYIIYSIPLYPDWMPIARPFFSQFTYKNPYTDTIITKNFNGWIGFLSQKIETIDSVSPDTVKKVSLLLESWDNVPDTLIKFYKIRVDSNLYIYKDLSGKSIKIQKIPVYAGDSPPVFDKPVTKWRLKFKVYYNNTLLESFDSDKIPISDDISRNNGIVKVSTNTANFFRELQFILHKNNVPYFNETAYVNDTLEWEETENKKGYKPDTISLSFLNWNGSEHFVEYSDTVIYGKVSLTYDTLPDLGVSAIAEADLQPEDTTWETKEDFFMRENGIIYTKNPANFINSFPDSGYLSKTYISDVYFETFKDSILKYPGYGHNLKQMFHFENSDSLISNPYLKIGPYDSLEIFYINKRKHHDLSSEKTLFNYSGYSKGKYDFLRPYLNLTYHPREYIPLRGKTYTGDYKIYIMRENKIYPVYDSILHRPKNVDTILGYIETSEIGENVKVLLYEYKPGYTKGEIGESPYKIRYRDFLIGDLFKPRIGIQYNGGEIPVPFNLKAKSPYARAIIQFSNSSFNKEVLTGICPLYPDSMEIEGSEPYIGGNFGPLLYLKPRGAKFLSPESKPTLYYYFTNKEKDSFKINLNDIKIYAIKEDGSLIPLNTIVSEDPNTGKITLQVMADSFPGEGNTPYFAAIHESETMDGKVLIVKDRFYKNEIHIEGVYLPFNPQPLKNSNVIFVLSREKIKNIYELKNKIQSQNQGNFIFRTSNIKAKEGKYTFSFNYYLESDTLYYFVLVGVNEGFFEMSHEQNILDGNQNIIKNFPVAQGVLIDTSFEIKVLPPKNPYAGDEGPGIIQNYLKFYANKSALIKYKLKKETGETLRDTFFNVSKFDTISIKWDGKIDGKKVETGDYPYEIEGFAQNGEYDTKEGVWHVRWESSVFPYAVILTPEDGSYFIPGDSVLLNAKVIGGNTRIEWSASIGSEWRFIGVQSDTLSPLVWHIPENYDTLIILKATPSGKGIPDFSKIYPYERNIPSDSTPPVITIIPLSNFYQKDILWISKLGKISIITEDKESEIDTSYILINNSLRIDFKDSVILGSQALNFGENDIYVFTQDKAGNKRDTSFVLGLDNLRPQVEIKFGQPHYVIGDTFFVEPTTPETLRAKDKGSGVSSIFYKIGNSGYNEVNDSVYVITISDNGLTTLSLYSIDNVNNVSETLKVFVKVKISPPVVKLTFPYDSIIFNQSFAIRGAAYNVQKWRLLYGYGANPSSYILLKEGNYEIQDSLTPIDTFPPSQIPDGVYTIRLEGIGYQDTSYVKRIIYKGNFDVYDSIQVTYSLTWSGEIKGNDKFFYYVCPDPNSHSTVHLNKYQILDSLIFIDTDTLRHPDISWIFSLNGICLFPDHKIFIFFDGLSESGTSYGYIWKYKNGIYNLFNFDTHFGHATSNNGELFIVEASDEPLRTFISIRDSHNLVLIDSFTNFPGYMGTEDFDIAVKDSICYVAGCYYFPNIYLFKIGSNTPFDSIILDGIDRISLDDKGLLWVVASGKILCFSPFKEKIFYQPLWRFIIISSFYVWKNRLLILSNPQDEYSNKIFLLGYEIQDQRIQSFFFNPNIPFKIQKLYTYPSLYNPDKGFLRINFYLPTETQGEVLIYTLSEKLVKRIKFYGRKGLNTILWDGRNEIGLPVRNGVYVALVKVKNGFFKDEKYTKFIIRR